MYIYIYITYTRDPYVIVLISQKNTFTPPRLPALHEESFNKSLSDAHRKPVASFMACCTANLLFVQGHDHTCKVSQE